MMKTIDRYYLREFLPPFGFSLFALTFILLMDQLFRLIDLIVRKGLPLDIVGLILAYTLPLIVSYTAPMAILVAVVMSFGRLAQDNEILALKSSGFSFFELMKKPLVIIGLFAAVLVFFNDRVVPESNHRVRNLMLDVSRKRPAVRLTEGIFSSEFPGYMVYIQRKDERTSRIWDVTIYDLRNHVIVTAPRGEIVNLETEGILRFVLYDGELHQLVAEDRYQKTVFEKDIINMMVDTDLIRRERKARTEDEMDSAALARKLRETKREVGVLRDEVAAMGRETLDRYLRGDARAVETARFFMNQKATQIKAKLRERSRLEIEINKKYSLAAACLIFLLIGAPLGYVFRRGGVAGIIVGVLLFSLYYILVLTGEELADRRGFSPFWALWLPNIVLLVPGVIMFIIAEFDRWPGPRLIRPRLGSRSPC
jgi:lipopolysaccharide export system permease protein